MNQLVGGNTVQLGVVRGDVEGSIDEVVLDAEHGGTCVEQDDHDDNLIDDLAEDGSPHFRQEDLVVLLYSSLLKLSWVGRLGGKSNGGESVHDHVDPEELDDVEWAVSESGSTEEHDEESTDVNSHLEDNELSDVVVDVSSPLGGSED